MMSEPVCWRKSGVDLTHRTLRHLECNSWFSDALMETILTLMLDKAQNKIARIILSWNRQWKAKLQTGNYDTTAIVVLENSHFYVILVLKRNAVRVIDSLALNGPTQPRHLDHVRQMMGLQITAPEDLVSVNWYH